MEMRVEGGCYCEASRYEISAKPVMKAQCHCRECQYFSGGAPNVFLVVPNDGFRFTRGEVAAFARPDIDSARTRQFCPTCGTHMTTLLPDRPLTVVKVGTLDDPARDFGMPALAVYMKDSQPFHLVAEGLPCFQELPPGA